MTLNDYQKAAERTSGDLTSWDKVRNGCYGLNGEAGECIDILKKTEFQGHDFDPMKMVDELGDVLWYVAQLATGLGVTADLREWRHFCRMRCPVAAHPDMRVVANMLLTLLKQTYPVFFEDIEV